MKKRVYVVDALNYIFRAYHALPPDITSPTGVLTNAVLGYLRTLLRIIREAKPEYMAAAFEKNASFRSSIFPAYKANRKQTPQDLEAQFDYCRRITEAIGVTCIEKADYEADDVIGTIATRMSAARPSRRHRDRRQRHVATRLRKRFPSTTWRKNTGSTKPQCANALGCRRLRFPICSPCTAIQRQHSRGYRCWKKNGAPDSYDMRKH